MAFNRWFKKNKKLNYYQKEIVLQNSQSRRVKKLIINENNNHYRYSNISEEELKKWRIKQPKPLPLPYWLCSTKQIILIVLCFGIALFFTIFDKWDDGHLKQRKMVNCSIILAIRQKSLVFGFLSLILIIQLLQSLLWYFIPLKSIKKSKKMSCRHSSIFNFLVFSCRDLFLLEALGWGLVALLTGLALFQKFVLTSPCNKVRVTKCLILPLVTKCLILPLVTNCLILPACTQLAIELPFTTLPLLISLLHPILELILITPIRYSTQHFFPLFSKLLPTQEPVTPPLPRTFPSVRILITEH
ncbi:hypothetical protein Mgra_00005197 [Meloidogyne graminicola]|uniref:Uncharacterized protein n=1 Tax=Meloidogyne graminicola TaxID=189291 RepID=A0A8S9ZP94_9BILA|nr:hypothetical protein Mgra_00005197 [Meloidogyne graminicola]